MIIRFLCCSNVDTMCTLSPPPTNMHPLSVRILRRVVNCPPWKGISLKNFWGVWIIRFVRRPVVRTDIEAGC